ncbi:MAG: 3-dehydroquinate synthase [Promethearchaeota archaeon CR_4]|nr:MAG: 3-dehydroquinate synthase [Candidatus Lokiarchaeota archaeon CR_4]
MKKIILEMSTRVSHADELIQASINHGIKSYYAADEIVARLKKVAGGEIFSPLRNELPQYVVYPITTVEEATKHAGAAEDFAFSISLKKKADEQLAIAVAKLGSKYVIVEAKDWKIIPFENLIAAFHTLDTQLIARVADLKEAELMLHTLERGVDGVMMAPTSPNDIIDLKNLITTKTRVNLTPALVLSVKEIPRGDRVCVDTTSLLRAGEGMLVGSTARGFVLVHAEVFETEFVASRPFRVNAGDVSAYILVPGEDPTDPEQYRTNYLSELGVGSPVIVSDTNGNTRIVNVGRVKIETRPMLVLKLVAKTAKQEIPINIVLQNAETIRVVSKDGKPISVTQLKPGMELLARIGPGATHFGTMVKETILEK